MEYFVRVSTRLAVLQAAAVRQGIDLAALKPDIRAQPWPAFEAQSYDWLEVEGAAAARRGPTGMLGAVA